MHKNAYKVVRSSKRVKRQIPKIVQKVGGK